MNEKTAISEEIVSCFIAGDIDAFEFIYSRTKDFVYRIIYKMVNDKQRSEDLMQDVFIRIYENREKFNRRSSIRTWIYRVAINYTLNNIKKRRHFLNRVFKFEIMDNSKYDSSYDDEEDEDMQRIKRLLEEIKPEYKICLLLKENEDMSYADIANLLGINIGTVRSRISRGRQQLIRLFRKEMSNDER